MKGPNIFQIVLMGIFGAMIAGGVLFFVLFKGSNPLSNAGRVTMWGTLSGSQLHVALEKIQKNTSGLQGVDYVEKDPRTFETEILEALAAGKGPDLVMLSQDQILANRDRIQFIPYTTYSERVFRDTFLDAGEVLMFPQGLAGLPFAYDPLVLYWNKDMFATAGIVNPPKFWDEVLTMVPKLTRIDDSQNVLQSGLAFGASTNILHSKDILSLLMLQAGSPVAVMDASGQVTAALNANLTGSNDRPGESALRFYTEFTNTIKTVYSWNNALPEARQAFLAGDLAMYIGYASEYPEMKQTNPNLNFDLATVPQSRTAPRKTSTGKLTSFVIPKLAKNQRGAYIAMALLSQSSPVEFFTDATKLPPVRRDLLAKPQSDAYRSVLFESAIIGREWLDPDPAGSKRVFDLMVEDVVSGRKDPGKAVGDGNTALGNLYK